MLNFKFENNELKSVTYLKNSYLTPKVTISFKNKKPSYVLFNPSFLNKVEIKENKLESLLRISDINIFEQILKKLNEKIDEVYLDVEFSNGRNGKKQKELEVLSQCIQEINKIKKGIQ